ncbi:hypothetical protein CDAR_470561 [Caerostris darwini]|uniref:Uncharacterized protein n=1 Tax=Caerostris darwini TaxID=1538125 RepID=A0AAV4VIN0_9ARAC|nr:hypothetical protein CDAR_470561 [Caerostris darwini]
MWFTIFAKHKERLQGVRRAYTTQNVKKATEMQSQCNLPSSSNKNPSCSTSASTYVVIKDEFVVCSEDCSVSSAVVPPSTDLTSHITLSVACLRSSEQPDIGR